MLYLGTSSCAAPKVLQVNTAITWLPLACSASVALLLCDYVAGGWLGGAACHCLGALHQVSFRTSSLLAGIKCLESCLANGRLTLVKEQCAFRQRHGQHAGGHKVAQGMHLFLRSCMRRTSVPSLRSTVAAWAFAPHVLRSGICMCSATTSTTWQSGSRCTLSSRAIHCCALLFVRFELVAFDMMTDTPPKLCQTEFRASPPLRSA